MPTINDLRRDLIKSEDFNTGGTSAHAWPLLLRMVSKSRSDAGYRRSFDKWMKTGDSAILRDDLCGPAMTDKMERDMIARGFRNPIVDLSTAIDASMRRVLNRKSHGTDWYDRRHDLVSGMCFKDCHDGIVMLDYRVPGDGTKWVVSDWSDGHWFHEGREIEPGDLALMIEDPSMEEDCENSMSMEL